MSTIALLLLLGQAPAGGAGQANDAKEPAYLAEFRKLKEGMSKLEQSFMKEYMAAKSEDERELVEARAMKLMNEKGRPLVEKALALVEPHAADKQAVQILTWIINQQPQASAKAAELLARHHLKDPQTLEVAGRFDHAPMPWTEKLLRQLADADLPRDQKVRALLALAECLKSEAEFPVLLANLDPHMMKIVEFRYGKAYLAQVRAADSARLEKEAARIFEEAAEKYGTEKYRQKTVAVYVKAALFEMRNLAIGKQAPDIDGEDIDGKKFRLSDYRGKVVVLDFWGNW